MYCDGGCYVSCAVRLTMCDSDGWLVAWDVQKELHECVLVISSNLWLLSSTLL